MSKIQVEENIVWHAGNDGSNSGLDADMLDGKHANEFADKSHNHDDLYAKKSDTDSKLTNVYTKNEINNIIDRGYTTSHTKHNLSTGWYTIAVNSGSRASARFGIWEEASSRHQAITFYAGHHFGQNDSNTLTVLHASHYHITPFRHIRIKDYSTYSGAALQVYIDNKSNTVSCAILGDNFTNSGWELVDWIPDNKDPGKVKSWSNFTTISQLDLDKFEQGGMATTGEMYIGGNKVQHKVWHAGNDGSNSGLDADMLDGKHASSFVKYSNGSDIYLSGKLVHNGDSDTYMDFGKNSWWVKTGGETRLYVSSTHVQTLSKIQAEGGIDLKDKKYLKFGDSDDVEFHFSGADFYTDINNGYNWILRDGNSSDSERFRFDIDLGKFTASGSISTTSNMYCNTQSLMASCYKDNDSPRAVSKQVYQWNEKGVINYSLAESPTVILAKLDLNNKTINVKADSAGDADTLGGKSSSDFSLKGHNHDDVYAKKTDTPTHFTQTNAPGTTYSEGSTWFNSSTGKMFYLLTVENVKSWREVDMGMSLTSSSLKVVSGTMSVTNRRSKVWLGEDWNKNFVDIYPPHGYEMKDLVGFIASPGRIYFAGGVDGNDSLYCLWKEYTTHIRVICYNSENRSLGSINYMGIWDNGTAVSSRRTTEINENITITDTKTFSNGETHYKYSNGRVDIMGKLKNKTLNQVWHTVVFGEELPKDPINVQVTLEGGIVSGSIAATVKNITKKGFEVAGDHSLHTRNGDIYYLVTCI